MAKLRHLSCPACDPSPHVSRHPLEVAATARSLRWLHPSPNPTPKKMSDTPTQKRTRLRDTPPDRLASRPAEASASPGETGEATRRGRYGARFVRDVFGRALPAAGVLSAVLLFELAPRAGLVDERFFPPASAMLSSLGEQIADGSIWQPVGQTLQGWALGLGLAIAIALPLGTLIGSVFLLFMSTRSIVEFLRPVPSVALIPLAVLLFGAGLESKVFLATFAATWPILLQTLYGVRDIDPVAMETARSFGIPAGQRLLRVTLPNALPYIATGVRISSAVALILAVTAELVLGASGLGQQINIARQSGAVELMYGLIIATGLIGWGLNVIANLVEKRLLHWHPSQRGRAK